MKAILTILSVTLFGIAEVAASSEAEGDFFLMLGLQTGVVEIEQDGGNSKGGSVSGAYKGSLSVFARSGYFVTRNVALTLSVQGRRFKSPDAIVNESVVVDYLIGPGVCQFFGNNGRTSFISGTAGLALFDRPSADGIGTGVGFGVAVGIGSQLTPDWYMELRGQFSTVEWSATMIDNDIKTDILSVGVSIQYMIH